jgi:glyceraldehyde-3-phosphate dehydrogenase/erythrose-4-phosphate dehydrogenase
LIPAYGLVNTEKNIAVKSKVILSISNREVQGLYSKRVGFVVEGTGKFIKSGTEYDLMKAKFDGARAVLEITITFVKQTL